MTLNRRQQDRIKRLERTGRVLLAEPENPACPGTGHVFTLEPDTEDSADIRVTDSSLDAFLTDLLTLLRDEPWLRDGYTCRPRDGVWEVSSSVGDVIARGEGKARVIRAAIRLLYPHAHFAHIPLRP